jgi:hypothetical protein
MRKRRKIQFKPYASIDESTDNVNIQRTLRGVRMSVKKFLVVAAQHLVDYENFHRCLSRNFQP